MSSFFDIAALLLSYDTDLRPSIRANPVIIAGSSAYRRSPWISTKSEKIVERRSDVYGRSGCRAIWTRSNAVADILISLSYLKVPRPADTERQLMFPTNTAAFRLQLSLETAAADDTQRVGVEPDAGRPGGDVQKDAASAPVAFQNAV